MINLNETINNFKVIDKVNFDEYSSVIYTLEHNITKTRVTFIKNNDKELTFTFAFKTPVENDMGLSHIIEHSVLSGSSKYKVKDPFKTVGKGSVNTFLNAMTFSDFTLYPAASPLEADFKHLFLLYSDSVFLPLLSKNIFMQEGIRLVLEPKPHFEGVVFSEMSGEEGDVDNYSANAVIRKLYKDTYYRYESGGDNLSMCDLKYQDFLDFYNKYYHPSNCNLILYGDISDISYYLNILDTEYLSNKKEKKLEEKVKVQKPFDKVLEKTIEVEKTSEKDDDCLYILGYSTLENSNAKNILSLSLLVDILLGNPGSVLYKAIIDSKLSQDIYNYSGVVNDIYQMPLLIGFSNIKEKNIEKANKLIIKTLKKVVKNHLDPLVIEGCLRRQKFSLYEQTSGMPKGLNLTLRALRSIYDNKPILDSLSYDKALQEIENELKENPLYFENLIQKYILDNNHCVKLLVRPTKDAKAKRESLINDKALLRYSEIDDIEKYKKVLEDFDEYEKTEDDENNIKAIPLLKIEELPKQIREDKLKTDDNINYILTNNKDIIYSLITFDASDLDKDEALLLPLLARLIKLSGPKNKNYEEFIKQMNLVVGSYNTNIEEGIDLENNNVINLQIIFKTLIKYKDEALDNIFDLLLNLNINKERVKATIEDLKANYKSNIYGSPHYYAIIRGTYLNNNKTDSEFLSGLSQWKFLDSLKVNKNLLKSLVNLKNKLLGKKRVSYYFALKEKEYDSVVKKVKAFDLQLNNFDKNKNCSRDYKINVLPYVATVGNVSYQSYSFISNFDQKNKHLSSLATKILSTELLWNELRMKGGAYGAGALYDLETDLINVYTYRDPNLSSSTNTIISCLQGFYKTINERELYDAKVQSIGSDLRPIGTQSELALSYKRRLYKISDSLRQEKREVILNSTIKELTECAKKIEENCVNGKTCCLASKQMLLENGIDEKDIDKMPW